MNNVISFAGEIEVLMEMKTYMQTGVCTRQTDVLVLELKHFESIFVQRPLNADILASIWTDADVRLRSRMDRMQGVDRTIPLLIVLLVMVSRRREENAAAAAAAFVDGRGARRASILRTNRDSRSDSISEYGRSRRASFVDDARTSIQRSSAAGVDLSYLSTLTDVRRGSRSPVPSAPASRRTSRLDDAAEDVTLAELETKMKSWMKDVVSDKSGHDRGRECEVRVERLKRPSLGLVSATFRNCPA